MLHTNPRPRRRIDRDVAFALAPWASRRRRDLLELLDRLDPTIAELTRAIEQEAEKRPEAKRLMTHPRVGPLTALVFVLILGTAERFPSGKPIASYLGLVATEESSGNRRRLGHISKQGKLPVPLLAGGSGASDGPQRPRMAQPVFPPDDAGGRETCYLCPRNCGVDRLNDKVGVCKTGRYAMVSSYFPHFGEEDCLRGIRGSGTIFFSW